MIDELIGKTAIVIFFACQMAAQRMTDGGRIDNISSSVTREQIEGFAQTTALGRIGTPADIANAVTLLQGEDAGWVTGQNI